MDEKYTRIYECNDLDMRHSDCSGFLNSPETKPPADPPTLCQRERERQSPTSLNWVPGEPLTAHEGTQVRLIMYYDNLTITCQAPHNCLADWPLRLIMDHQGEREKYRECRKLVTAANTDIYHLRHWAEKSLMIFINGTFYKVCDCRNPVSAPRPPVTCPRVSFAQAPPSHYRH